MHEIKYELHSFNPAYVRMLEKMGDGFNFIYNAPDFMATLTAQNNGHEPYGVEVRQIGHVLLLSFKLWYKPYDNLHTLVMHQQAALDMLNFLYSDPAKVRENFTRMVFEHAATGLVDVEDMGWADLLALYDEYKLITSHDRAQVKAGANI